MRTLPVLVASLVLVAPAAVVEAFDKCRQVAENPAAFVERAAAAVPARLPFKYFNQASAIIVKTHSSDGQFFPVAFSAQRMVAVHSLFPEVFCKILLAEYLHVARFREAEFDQAVRVTAQCLDSGKSLGCLIRFANELEELYAGVFERLGPTHLQAALRLLDAALGQIIVHEYGHHVLEHSQRMERSVLTRIDAEFEADYLAITTGVNAIEIPATLFYFFRPLAEVEQYTRKLSTKDYESWVCRAMNVNIIAGAVGWTPSVVLSTLQGKPPHPTRTALSREDMEGPGPRLNPKACGRVGHDVLLGGFGEMRALYRRVMSEETNLAADTKAMDGHRSAALAGDLVTMARTFRYMGALAARCVMTLLERHLVAGMSETRILKPRGDLLDISALRENVADWLTADVGKAARIEGLNILRNRTDLARETRLNRSFDLLQEARRYDSSVADTLADLAIVAFKKGNCAAAADFTRSLIDVDANSTRIVVLIKQSSVEFLSKMKALASNARECRREGAALRIFAGL